MAIKLRETKHIRGIEIKLNSITGNLKNCQLADDTTLFLKTKHENPLFRIHPFISVYIVRIHLMNDLLKQNFSRHSVINDHSKESNAFVKSRNNMA
jgi:hypothetical protein